MGKIEAFECVINIEANSGIAYIFNENAIPELSRYDLQEFPGYGRGFAHRYVAVQIIPVAVREVCEPPLFIPTLLHYVVAPIIQTHWHLN